MPWERIVSPEGAHLPTGKFADAIGQLWGFFYRLPQLGGYGDHWPLSPMEERTLGRVTDTCIRSLPKARRAKWEASLFRWLPWLSLMTTAYIITAPRVNTTNLMLLGRRAHGSGESARGAGVAAGGIGGPAPAGADGDDGRPDGLPTWADFARVRGQRH